MIHFFVVWISFLEGNLNSTYCVFVYNYLIKLYLEIWLSFSLIISFLHLRCILKADYIWFFFLHSGLVSLYCILLQKYTDLETKFTFDFYLYLTSLYFAIYHLRNIYFIYIELHLCHHCIYFIFLYFFYFYKIILFMLLENFISLYFIHKYHFLMLFSLLCVTYLATKFSNLNF